MKAYLGITGFIFLLLTIVHAWRLATEWPGLSDKAFVLGMVGSGLIAAGLAAWSFFLLLQARKNK